MATARRKATEEPAVRSAAGSRLARERMVPVAGQVFSDVREAAPSAASSAAPSAASGLLMPHCAPESPAGADLSLDWLSPTTPDIGLRLSLSGQGASERRAGSGAVLLSVFVHASVLALALLALPKVSQLPAGGEAAIPIEMVFVAPDVADAPAAESGAKQEVAEISVPLPPTVTEAVIVPSPEAALAPPDPAPPVIVGPAIVEANAPTAPIIETVLPEPAPPAQIEAPAERITTPEPPAPVLQPQEQPPPAPVEPEGFLPLRSEPVAVPAPSKPRPAVDQDRTRRDALAAREARRQDAREEAREEQREAQRQAQITERRKQQAQRAVVDAQRRAAAEASRPEPATARRATQAQGETDAGPQQVTRQARQAGDGTQGANATSGTAEIASYRSRILAHLARYKIYPESAQDAGIQGRTTVSFTITRAGGVIAASLAGSSGAGVLDQATLAMVRRAQPFPAMPAGGPASMSFIAVIRYDLR